MDYFASEYARLCQSLGDLTYKNQQISKLIAETEAQIAAINLLQSKIDEQKKEYAAKMYKAEKAAEEVAKQASEAKNVRE